MSREVTEALLDKIDELQERIKELEKELEKRHTCDNPLGIPHEPE